MLANVQQTTIRPLIEGVVAEGSRLHTDEYALYARLEAWGSEPKWKLGAPSPRRFVMAAASTRVTRMAPAFARSTSTRGKGRGHCCAHGYARTGAFSQEKLPAYLGFFQFVYNARRRGKALLGALVAALVT